MYGCGFLAWERQTHRQTGRQMDRQMEGQKD